MSNPSGSLKAAARLDKSAFDLVTGTRAAAFAVTPLAIGLVVDYPLLLIATLGAFFVIGTLGFAAIPLVVIGIFEPLIFGSDAKWTQVTMFTAIVFAVGVGLPGASVSASGERSMLFLLGAIWGLFGAWAHTTLRNRRAMTATTQAQSGPLSDLVPRASAPHSDVFTHALAVGVASAFGLAIGLVLGLPRDFWIIVTLIVTLRPNLGSTVSSTSIMVLGTVVGAASRR